MVSSRRKRTRLQQIPIMTLPMTTFITQRAQQTITINGERYTASEAKISASDGKSLLQKNSMTYMERIVSILPLLIFWQNGLTTATR